MALSDFSHKHKKKTPENVEGVRDDIVKILSATKVSELKLKDQPVILNVSTSPKKAIEILVKNKVRAAPVMDNNHEFIGVLDLRDTLKYVLASYDSLFGSQNAQSDDQKMSGAHAMDYLIGDHSPMTSQTLTDLCENRPFRIVSSADSLLKLSTVFALGSHVIGVINNDKKLIGVVTQGQFFQQIAARWKFVHWCSLNKLFQLKYITSPVIIVNKTTKAVDAFKLMNNKSLSGLAVVNETGVLIHNTSATDIKLWLLKGEQSLDATIELFLINIRNLAVTERYPITVCSLNDTFKRAIQKLQATKYHRLWIVDHETKPIGVLALTDIFKFIGAMNDKNKKISDEQKEESKQENENKKQESKDPKQIAQSFVGKIFYADLDSGNDANGVYKNDVKEIASTYRALYPDSVVTMDFDENRLNIHMEKDTNKILKVTWT